MGKILERILEPLLVALVKRLIKIIVDKVEATTGKIDNPLARELLEALDQTETLDREQEINRALLIHQIKTQTQTQPNDGPGRLIQNGD